MTCLECASLARTLKAALAKYRDARSAVFYRVSTEFAAMKQVDMERVKSSIQDHESACPFAVQVGPSTEIEVENPGSRKAAG
jgi:hypothetical protein